MGSKLRHDSVAYLFKRRGVPSLYPDTLKSKDLGTFLPRFTHLISSHLISSGFYEMKSTCITWLQIHLGTFLHLRAASTFLGSGLLVDWEHHDADKHYVCMRTPKVANMIHLNAELKEIFTRGTPSNVHSSLSDWRCYVQGHGVLAHLLLTLPTA